MDYLTEYDAKWTYELFREEGLEEGRKEGLKLGLEEGRAEGRKEGRAEGRVEGLKQGLEYLLASGIITQEEAQMTEEHYKSMQIKG